MERFEHLILTRFSVKPAADSGRFDKGWLAHRLELLQAFCVPSVRNQTNRNFRWLLFCDETTDLRVLHELEDMLAAGPDGQIVLTGRDRSALPEILASVAKRSDFVVTTRVDSDDSLNLTFVERVQAYARAFAQSDHDAILLNFPHGYKLAPDGSLYGVFSPHSAFMTLFEKVRPSRPVRSVQTGNHGHLHFEYPVHQDVSMVGWLQVVHGGNVSNRVGGADVPVPTECLAGRFAVRPGTVPAVASVPAPQPQNESERAAFRQDLEESLLPRRSPP